MKPIRSAVFAVAFLVVGMTDPGAAAPAKSETANLHVPITINKPAALLTGAWPVTVGIPFKKGEVVEKQKAEGRRQKGEVSSPDFAIRNPQSPIEEVPDLTIVGEDGKPVPCQIIKTADWEDGSLRWALADFNADLGKKYFLTQSKGDDHPHKGGTGRPLLQDDIQIKDSVNGITVETGGALYVFAKSAGCFDTLRMDLNHDGKFDSDETLVSGAATAFYVVDSQGRRGVLKGTDLKVEINGKRHAVVRVEGEYRDHPSQGDPARDEKGARNAAAVIYFHFYAGCSQVRISHKLIVTEDTNELWFRDIGLSLPLKMDGATRASFNNDHDKPGASSKFEVRGSKLENEVVMLQDDFPHFGSMTSHFSISEGANGGSFGSTQDRRRPPLQEGAACGDWADVSSARWGLAAQAPAFAEQFPKAFRVSSKNLTIKLWAEEGGKELDFRTPQMIKNYLGPDWFPDGAKTFPEGKEVAKIANTAQGTAKTHEIWIYPHAGALTPEISAGFGATREEIHAAPDPAWVARSGVMGPIHPKDIARFPEAEDAISDYFDRTAVAEQKIFPATGYLYWGKYPYGAGPWKVKKEENRWYPTIHRLSRCLEYNFKRGVWVAFGRSGERKYYDYARKYTRFLGDLLFSNWDSPLKPKGWITMGDFHSPIMWGSFGEEALRAAKSGRRCSMQSEASFIAVASSEDVIQFAYDYFLTGDLQSRDMARTYKEALIQATDLEVEKTLVALGGRPEAMLRMVGSAYDLDHDPRLLEFGTRMIQRMALPNGELNEEVPAQYGKWGELFGAYYYYYISTGDPLARKVLVRLAEFKYRHAELEDFYDRSSPLLQAFALAYEDTGDPVYAIYLARELRNVEKVWPTLKKMGVDVATLNQRTSTPWGQIIMTPQGVVNMGLPAAEAAVAKFKGAESDMPVAIKPYSTQRTTLLLNKRKPGGATLDVYVNNWGDRKVEPQLTDAKGQMIALELKEREYDRVPKPDFVRDPTYSKWFNKYEDHIFLRLRIPESVPAGIYQLDLGSEVNFTVLNSEINQVVQLALKGVVILPFQRGWFNAPAGLDTVEYFSTLPVKVFDSENREVSTEDLKNGKYRFKTGGKRGPWSLERTERIPTFVRMDSFPLILAFGDSKRLFEVDPQPFVADEKRVNVDAKESFAEGKFGKAANRFNQWVQVALPVETPPQASQAEGTIEFWLCPLWSVTDLDFALAALDLQLFQMDPVSLSYRVESKPSGADVYHNARLQMQVHKKVGSGRAQLYLEAGKWYHLALTWKVDGRKSACGFFVNGCKKSHFHYAVGMNPNASPADLAPAAQMLKFGSGHQTGRVTDGELFDELRVSRIVRYREDFQPPAGPFEPDPDTLILMHLDGNTEALVKGKPVTGEIKTGSKLW